MKKQLLGAAVAAVLMAGNAHAALPTIATDTSVVYLSGASASLDFIDKLLTSTSVPAADKICDNGQPIWKFSDQTNGKTQNAFYCTKASTNASLTNAKSHLLIYKRSEGGSAMGVNPLVNNDAISFLNVTSNPSCVEKTALNGINQVTCDYDKDLLDASKFTLATADFGMSDVDPIQFRGENTPAGFNPITADDLAALTVSGASAVVFGEPVTLQLYKALQAAQLATGQIPATTKAVIASTGVAVGDVVTCKVGDRINEGCMPSLTSAEIASIHSGSWADWNSLKVTVNGVTKGLENWISTHADPAIKALAPASTSVHVCRRTNGSGTQAQHGIAFLNYPCADAAGATLAAHDFGTAEADGFVMVHELAESGGVTECLVDLNTGTNDPGTTAKPTTAFDNTAWLGGVRWAVGIQSLEKKDNNFEFVRVDGVAPTLAHVADGSYKDWVENTFQYNSAHYAALTNDKKAVVDTIVAKSALPEVVVALNNGFTHGFGNGSFLAVPTLFAPATNGVFASTTPVNPYSRATAGAAVENCRVPTIYNGGASKL